MAINERKVKQDEIGKCPFCNSGEYNRSLAKILDDFVYFRSKCSKCKKEFTETFELTTQRWYD